MYVPGYAERRASASPRCSVALHAPHRQFGAGFWRGPRSTVSCGVDNIQRCASGEGLSLRYTWDRGTERKQAGIVYAHKQWPPTALGALAGVTAWILPRGFFRDGASPRCTGPNVGARAKVDDQARGGAAAHHAASPWHDGSLRCVDLGHSLWRQVVVQCHVRRDALCERGSAPRLT